MFRNETEHTIVFIKIEDIDVTYQSARLRQDIDQYDRVQSSDEYYEKCLPL